MLRRKRHGPFVAFPRIAEFLQTLMHQVRLKAEQTEVRPISRSSIDADYLKDVFESDEVGWIARV